MGFAVCPRLVEIIDSSLDQFKPSVNLPKMPLHA